MANTTGMADRAVALVQEAVEANWQDPFRKGSLIEFSNEEGGELMIAGDLHGHLDNFRRIIETANLARFRSRHLILQEVVHSYDRPPGDKCLSFRLLEMAARLKCSYPDQAHIIIGNHEMAELLDLEVAKDGRTLNEEFDKGLRNAYKDETDRVKQAYKDFIKSLPLAARTATGIFISHSTPKAAFLDGLSLDYFRRQERGKEMEEDGALVRNSPAYRMIWGRDYKQETADSFADKMESETLVVGHQPCDEGFYVPNTRHIIIDSKDNKGRYLLLPLDQKLTQGELIQRIKRIQSTRGG